MSNKRPSAAGSGSGIPVPPIRPGTPSGSSKLPKFLQPKQIRDRAKSISAGHTDSSSSVSSANPSPPPPVPSLPENAQQQTMRRSIGSKFGGRGSRDKDREREGSSNSSSANSGSRFSLSSPSRSSSSSRPPHGHHQAQSSHSPSPSRLQIEREADVASNRDDAPREHSFSIDRNHNNDINDDDDDTDPDAETGADTETPVIIEPPSSPASVSGFTASPAYLVPPSSPPFSRSRPGRPSSVSSPPLPSTDVYPHGLISSSASAHRMPDLPTRLSGWFAQTFSSSSTDLSLPALLRESQSRAQIAQAQGYPGLSSSGSISDSPKSKSTNPLLVAARHGKGHLDKAVRYLLDSDAQPDKCSAPIWLLGVQHPGWSERERESPPPPPGAWQGAPASPSTSSSQTVMPGEAGKGRRSSIDSLARRASSFRSSSSSAASTSTASTASTSTTSSSAYVHDLSSSANSMRSSRDGKEKDPGAHWPADFYRDFTSRVWVTYRAQFVPIRDIALADLTTVHDPTMISYSPGSAGGLSQSQGQGQLSSSPVSGKRWHWPTALGGPGGGGDKGWTSDAGWGCMLRTGQSLLANSLVHLHLGRDWRRPLTPSMSHTYATYVQILSWFLDTPSPLAPFSVHRMALAGKELGKDVGQWFGPSTAAGAIKALVHAFPPAQLGVSVASDGVVFETDVYAASHLSSSSGGSPSSPARHSGWGPRAVLVLVGIRLGLDGVNPVYYDAIKTLYTFPQSVGIAGGRPSSSYYFVGAQADSLFYLDPHFARSAVPMRVPPPGGAGAPPITTLVAAREKEKERDREANARHARSSTTPAPGSVNSMSMSMSNNSARSSTFSYHAPASPSPLQQQLSTSSTNSAQSRTSSASGSGSFVSSTAPRHPRYSSASASAPSSSSADLDPRELGISVNVGTSTLDVLQEHYCTAYNYGELRTYHCEKVRKMPLSGLDPSMLIGFLCRDEDEWKDLRRRMSDLSVNHKTIFTIQDEPPNWPSDSDDNMGLESISEPDDLDMDMPEDEDDGEPAQFFDTRSPSTSPDTSVKGKTSSEPDVEGDTEEDPIGPLTPGPGGKPVFDTDEDRGVNDNGKSVDDFNEDDDEWVDPVSPISVKTRPDPVAVTPTPSKGKSSGLPGIKKSKTKKSKKAKDGAPVPVPSVEQHYPFPVSPDSPPPSRQSHSPEPRSVSPERAKVARMHTARARDGGRTQSGGVKGILTDDDVLV